MGLKVRLGRLNAEGTFCGAPFPDTMLVVTVVNYLFTEDIVL